MSVLITKRASVKNRFKAKIVQCLNKNSLKIILIQKYFTFDMKSEKKILQKKNDVMYNKSKADGKTAT